MLRPDIPVYLSPVTRRIIELGNDIREEWQTKVNMGSLIPVGTSNGFAVGNLNVRRFDVDHSLLRPT